MMPVDTSALKTGHAAAAAAGDKFYLGVECKKPGHGRVRYVNGHTCLVCSYENAARRRRRDQSSRTDTNGFNCPVFVLGKSLSQNQR
jgi:hypothetical protein